MDVMVFEVGGGTYGIELGLVEQVLMMVEIRPVRGMPPVVAGMINLRGELLPAVVMAERLGGPPGVPDQLARSSRILISRVPGYRIGILVGKVIGIEPLSSHDQHDEAVGDRLPFLDHAWLRDQLLIQGVSPSLLLSQDELSHLSRKQPGIEG